MYLVQDGPSKPKFFFCFDGVLLIPGTGLTRQDESQDIRDDVSGDISERQTLFIFVEFGSILFSREEVTSISLNTSRLLAVSEKQLQRNRRTKPAHAI